MYVYKELLTVKTMKTVKSSLTQEDVNRLLSEPSTEVRAELASKVGREIDNPTLTPKEMELAHDIIRIMAADVAAIVRATLSHNLRNSKNLPHDVAVKLANDIDKVAIPIIESSPVLTDEDLIEILKYGNETKQICIASRYNLSEDVSHAVVCTSGEHAVAALMENRTAAISESTFNETIDRFHRSDLVKGKIVYRANLPIQISERLSLIVADNLKDYLVTNQNISPQSAADIVLRSREKAIITMTGRSSIEDLKKMLSQMHENGRLTPTLVIRALCMGDVSFFEVAMSVMANIPLVNTSILIHEGGHLGLKSLYERSKMPMEFFPVIKTAIDVLREMQMTAESNGRNKFGARVIERILTTFEDGMNPEDANYLMDKLGDILRTDTATT